MEQTAIKNRREQQEYAFRKQRYYEKKRLIRRRRILVVSIITTLLCVIFFFIGVVVGRSFATGENQVAHASEKMVTNQKLPASFKQWNLILVNPDHKISDDVTVNLVETEQQFQIDERIKEPLETMLQDMRAEGLKPCICSAYRSMEKQKTLF